MNTFNKKETMVACLVQQLFRQKIGVELDQGIVEEVLFPLLRPRKHGPKELLQDIKLATDTLIITDYSRREARHFSIPTFTPIPEYWTYVPPGHLTSGSIVPVSPGWPLDKKLKGKFPFWISVGQRTSKVRRKKIRKDDWGTIDILNELRGLNYPQMGYKARSYVIEEPESFEDAYSSLAEDNSLPANIRWGVDHSRYNTVLIDGRSQFVKNFLDDVLITGKRLTWCPPDPGRLGWGILSIVESSQYGEVQSQLYTAGGGSSRR
jgi:hypothetical protein